MVPRSPGSGVARSELPMRHSTPSTAEPDEQSPRGRSMSVMNMEPAYSVMP